MKNLFDLSNRRALVTGSTRGIGNLLARGLAAHGASIVINGTTQERAEQAAQELVVEGYDASAVAFDVRDKKAIISGVETIEKTIGQIDILINNAGIQRRHPFLEFPEEEWDEIIEVNQKSVFLVSQVVGKYMVERQAGKIINICSMQSELGRDTITPYAASKGAVKMMTRGMCVELARYNIQVNGIAPGYFKSDMTKPLVEDKEFSAWLCNRTPANRWGDPEELIGAAVFLSSKASDFVNGHLIFVDGGMLAAV
ncbi:gluconate 5-dehydrogenase [Desulfogranum japonicum]|uniref:gluconate 5-dehydrogenase n=1 Tax=Desulfogranum japonicum TaxID=231447 RepID=UPI0004237C68|nr:gluconate 5-dehydrogenase [Desulfogranum japonicum]